MFDYCFVFLLHVYNYHGLFDIGLLLINEYGCFTYATFPNYITADRLPVVDFFSSSLVSCVGEDIAFSDLSSIGTNNWQWDFGDGVEVTTITGFTSHQFLNAGQFNVELTVTNDQGGSDSTSTIIRVNGAPLLNLSIPEVVRSGDIVLLDASGTIDPEGAPMDFTWDYQV